MKVEMQMGSQEIQALADAVAAAALQALAPLLAAVGCHGLAGLPVGCLDFYGCRWQHRSQRWPSGSSLQISDSPPNNSTQANAAYL